MVSPLADACGAEGGVAVIVTVGLGSGVGGERVGGSLASVPPEGPVLSSDVGGTKARLRTARSCKMLTVVAPSNKIIKPQRR